MSIKYNHLSLALRKLFEEQETPEGIELFNIDGNHVFPIYGTSGGICSSAIFYLIKRGLTAREGVEISLGPSFDLNKMADTLQEGITRFNNTLSKLEYEEELYEQLLRQIQ